MRADKACRECSRKKIGVYTELYQASAEKKEEIIRRAERYLDEAPMNLSAPRIMAGVLDILKEETGITDPYEKIKKDYDLLLLGMEKQICENIRSSKDPFIAALQYAIVGNYIDFGAFSEVDEEKLRELLNSYSEICLDSEETANLREELGKAERITYITDNAGEIVLDKICIRILKEIYPQLDVKVIVRGGPVLNDATAEDARLVGLDQIASIVPNGTSIPGTEYDQILGDARACIDEADLCIAKGQGNFESLRECGKNIYYLFLCKCDLFVERFQVDRLSPALMNEKR